MNGFLKRLKKKKKKGGVFTALFTYCSPQFLEGQLFWPSDS